MTSTTASKPFYAFQPTVDAVVTDWYEVVASYDTRVGMPREMAVAAISAEGVPSAHLAANCVEIELPGGAAIALSSDNYYSNVQAIKFPCRWRINKPPTADAVTFAVWGLGVTTVTLD